MKPNSIPSTLPSTMSANSVTPPFQTGSWPVTRLPTRVPRVPTTRATNIATTPTSTAPRNFAPSTRPRCGTRVKVVSPLRWLHSLVTARIAMIGRMIVIGAPMAAAKLSKVSCVVRARRR